MSELIVLYLFVFLLILVALAIATCLGVSRLEAAHPPTGEFVDVEGVRLHVVTLGLAPDNPHAEPAIVLIHGASGNLEDMRLALGESVTPDRGRAEALQQDVGWIREHARLGELARRWEGGSVQSR